MSEQLQYHPTWIREKGSNPCIEFILNHSKNVSDLKIIEFGTKKWGNKSTHHQDLFPNSIEYTKADFLQGEDVDVLMDLHDIFPPIGTELFMKYDIFWASSVWEHLKKPWIASENVSNFLKKGGVFFIQTHQTFPIHGFPHDYFRFTEDSLKSMFDWATDIITQYDYPCKIIPDDSIDHWNANALSYLNVCIAGRK